MLINSTFLRVAVSITVDNQHRVRSDRVTERAKEIQRIKSIIVNTFSSSRPSSRPSSPTQTDDQEANGKAKGVVKSASEGIENAGSRTKRAFVGVWIWLDGCVRSVVGRLGPGGDEGETRGLLD
jgi:hypothetical protein